MGFPLISFNDAVGLPSHTYAMTALFIAIFLVLVPVVLQVVDLSRCLRLPTILTCGVSCAAIIYLGSLLPGAFGYYSALPVGIATIVIALSVSIVLWKVVLIPSKQATVAAAPGEESRPEQWNMGEIALLVLASAGLSPVFSYLKQLPSLLMSPNTGMNWDVVSYHLPALAEFIQTKSLWSVDGPCQSFSQGYELIGGLSVLFFHSPWGLAAANTACIILVIAAIVYLSDQVARILLKPLNLPINSVLICVTSLALWLCMFENDIFAVGKNDLFEVATLMAAFAYLLDSISANQPRAKRTLLLIFATLAYGLSISTKPPSLIYLPLFAFMSGIKVFADKTGGNKFSFSWLTAIGTICGAILIGGFFELRNLVVFHQLVAPDLGAETSRMSIIHQWRHLELYNPFDRGALCALNGLVAIALCGFWRKSKAIYSYSVPLLCIVAFSLIGLGSFAFMPTSVVIEAGSMNFQDRKIMAVYILSGILVAIVIATRFRCLTTVKLSRAVLAIFATVLLAICPLLNYFAQREYPPGLPGYDQVKGLPKTEIYKWVQELPKPQRIYSAGLRPWGLYGRDLENKIFYDLHSHILDHGGEIRLLAIMKQFHPELILISVDPHSYTGPAHKPALVEWLRNQEYFTEVYNDDTVSGFTVKEGWESLLKQFSIPADPIHMHG
jgi:hypothetical protein